MGADVETEPCTFALRVDRTDDQVLVVGIDGELDSLTAPDTASCLFRCVAARSAHLVVDLSRTSFISSTGITVLLQTREGVERTGGRLHLVGVTGNRVVERALDVTGVSALFDIRDTVADALRD